MPPPPLCCYHSLKNTAAQGGAATENPRRQGGDYRGRCAAPSRKELLARHILIQIGDEFSVAVINLRRDPLPAADVAFRRLRPARMRDLGIDVGPEAILGCGQRFPEGDRPLVG